MILIWSLLLASIAIAIVLWSLPKLLLIARLKQLYDDTIEERKIHDGFIPNIGGIVLTIAIIVSFSLYPDASALYGYSYVIVASIILFSVGLKDDLLRISPLKKVISQILVSLIMIFGAGVYVTTFGGVFGVEEIPVYVSYLITFLVFTTLINGVNLIDGVDGLAAGFTMIASLFFSVWFLISGHELLFLFALVVSVTYGTFLWYNWFPASVFMGDTGSLLSGFFLAYMGIMFLNTGLNGPMVHPVQEYMAVLLVAILLLPIYDTLRVFLIRSFSGKSPFSPDANHIHHQFLKEGYNHSQTTVALLTSYVFVVVSTFILANFLSVNQLFLFLIIVSVLILPTNSFKRKYLTLFYKSHLDKDTRETNSNGITPSITELENTSERDEETKRLEIVSDK